MTTGIGWRFSWRHALGACGLAGLALWPAASPAAESERLGRLSRFHEARWLARDGAPGSIGAIAQTTDGFLWLASNRGLVRFDGVVFRPFDTVAKAGEKLTSSTIASLTPDPDGSLWIGYTFGGMSRLWHGHLTHYGTAQGLPVATVATVLHTRDDGLWVAASNNAYRLDHGVFRRLDDPLSPYKHPIHAADVLEDGAGNVWLSSSKVFELARGAERLAAVPLPVTPMERNDHPTLLRLAPSGRVWAAVDQGDHAMTGPVPLPGEDADKIARLWIRTPRVVNVAFRPDGALWFACDDGLHVIDPDAREAASPLETALAGESPNTVVVDREGTVWAGTEQGLSSYRATKLVTLPATGVPHLAITAGDAPGSILATTDHGALATRTYPRGVVEVPLDPGGKPLQALHRAPDGSLWIASAWGVWHRRLDGQVESFGVPDALKPTSTEAPGHTVIAFATDDAGDPWINFEGSTFYRHHGGRWLGEGGRRDIPHLAVFVFATDPHGRLWISQPGNGILRLDHADAPGVTRMADVQVGVASVIAFAGERTWIGGDDGLALIDGGGTHAIVAPGTGLLSEITGLVQTANGDLWLNCQSGVVRIPRAEIERRLADAGHRIALQQFDYLDGLPGPPEAVEPLPTLVDDRAGRLWFAQKGVLMTVTPARMQANAVKPPVAIDAVTADGHAVDWASGLVLPAGTHDVRIEFTALSLALPQRVRFRYRLEGQDADWSAPTAERDANYTNLAPGHYVFRVIAANEDDVWNDTGASLQMRVLPAFWQTTSFRALCVAAAAALLYSLHSARLGAATRRAQERQRARTAERERIARDLHDTLLQSSEGLLLRIHAAMKRIPLPEDVRRSVEATLAAGSRVAEEARDRVQALRSTPALDFELAESLRDLQDERPDTPRSDYEATRIGTPRPLMPAVQDEVFNLAREALRNAFAHAQASKVRLQVRYDADALRVTVSDDGIGIAPELMTTSARDGHWGLKGMHERAESLGGALRFSSATGAGTRITLVVPARRAYEAGGERTGWLRSRLRARRFDG